VCVCVGCAWGRPEGSVGFKAGGLKSVMSIVRVFKGLSGSLPQIRGLWLSTTAGSIGPRSGLAHGDLN
jgi:hypothetical protein